MAGIKDIAEQCGVTAATVSLALSNHPRISESRRKEIHSAAARLGYRPNVIAQSLRGGKTNSIGILWSLSGPHNPVGLIRSVALKLMDAGYVSYVADSLSDPRVIKQCLRDYITRNIDGLIFQDGVDLCSNPEICELLKKIPLKVIVDDAWENHDTMEKLNCDFIKRDHAVAIKEIVRFCKESGRRKVFMISHRQQNHRVSLFKNELQINGFLDEGSLMINTSAELTDITNEVVEWLSVGNFQHDAIIATNDEVAGAVITVLVKNGIKVPENVAVIGFNDSLLSKHFIPPIASVNRRDNELAAMTVEMLMEILKNPELPPRSKSLAMEFVKRESAG
ncbi:MAG: LacI family DNA-binding transcriptional regulator [Victivallaceae bacterium]